jgi:hypothetical protein
VQYEVSLGSGFLIGISSVIISERDPAFVLQCNDAGPAKTASSVLV